MEKKYFKSESSDIHPITKRIDDLLDAKNYGNKRELADKLAEKGIKKSAFYRWWQKKTPPSTGTLIAIGELHKDVNMNWLFKGIGPMLITQPESLMPVEKKSPLLEYTRLEVLITDRVRRLEEEIGSLKEEFGQMKTLITENTRQDDKELPPADPVPPQ